MGKIAVIRKNAWWQDRNTTNCCTGKLFATKHFTLAQKATQQMTARQTVRQKSKKGIWTELTKYSFNFS